MMYSGNRASVYRCSLQSFRVEFEVNIIVVFEDNYLVTENFPITLFREPQIALK
jgi:hypothetical protein